MLVKKLKDEFIVTEHFDSISNINYIDKKNVQLLLNGIKKLSKEKNIISYIELVRYLKGILRIRISDDAFNGGKNRRKYYFINYYYPCKILQHYNIIEYSKRGTILLLDKKAKL